MTTRMRVTTIEQTAKAMAELAVGIDPSMLQALRAAGISPKMRLKTNCDYAEHLCQYRDVPLPARDVLMSGFSHAGLSGIMQSHVNTLYAIDAFWFGNGAEENRSIAYNIGETLDEQRAWRCRMNSLIWGMGFKCLSWALTIYAPETCQLLPLDTWHARRLQVEQTTFARDSELSHSYYEQLESQIIAEVNSLYPGYPSTVGAACLWYNVRNSGPESHAGLNCRIAQPEEQVA